ncbi:MAG TPA: hypothetical protein VF469_16440, partial [Kofleriaceae bacterium]
MAAPNQRRLPMLAQSCSSRVASGGESRGRRLVGRRRARHGALAIAANTAASAELSTACPADRSVILCRQGRQLEVRDSGPRSLPQVIETRQQLRAVERAELGGDVCGSTFEGSRRIE